MAKIYKTTDRIELKIDDVTVKVSPLNYEQKSEIEVLMRENNLSDKVQGIVLAIRYGVKEISGVEDSDGKPYELQFENGVLTKQCVSDLLNLDIKDKLSIVCSSFVPGVPKSFYGPDGNLLDGVEFVDKADSKKN